MKVGLPFGIPVIYIFISTRLLEKTARSLDEAFDHARSRAMTQFDSEYYLQHLLNSINQARVNSKRLLHRKYLTEHSDTIKDYLHIAATIMEC